MRELFGSVDTARRQMPKLRGAKRVAASIAGELLGDEDVKL